MLRRCWKGTLAGCLLLLLLGMAEHAAPAKDWPQWRGALRDGISTEKGLLPSWPEDGPKMVWNSKTVNNKSLGRGYSSVTVSDGRIFTQGDRAGDGLVFCLEEATGKLLWETKLNDARGDGPRCSPTVDGERVYALSRDGDLACLNVKDGAVVWKIHYKKDLGGRMMSGWDYSESPLVDGDKLICTPGGETSAIVALDKHKGTVLWQSKMTNTGGAGYASIIKAEAGGVPMYVTLFGRCIAAFRASDGEFLWRYNKIANGTANIPTPIVKGDLIFTSTAYGTGAALLQLVPAGDGKVDVKEIYFLKGNTLQNHHGGMVLIGDHIYGGHGHNQGNPFCVEMKTGKFAWGPERGAGDGSAAVVYADGKLYYRYQSGVMALIEATPSEYKLVSKFALPKYTGTPSWPHPVVANGRLYIRGNDVLLSYDLKQQ